LSTTETAVPHDVPHDNWKRVRTFTQPGWTSCGEQVAPDNPPDPEAAALEPIVRLPADLLGGNWPTHETSQEFALTTAGFLHLRASW